MIEMDTRTQEEIVTIFQEIGASPIQTTRILHGLRGAEFPLSVAMMFRIVVQQKIADAKRRLEIERKTRQKAMLPAPKSETQSPGETEPYSLPKDRHDFFNLKFSEICWLKAHRPDIYGLYMRK